MSAAGIGKVPVSVEGPALARPSEQAGGAFAKTIGQALAQVDALQTQADGEAQKVAHGGGNLHELSLALEKADVAMRVAVKARNKLVDAYNEVMRMSV